MLRTKVDSIVRTMSSAHTNCVLGRASRYIKSVPQVLHCDGFHAYGRLLVNRRRSLQNSMFDMVCLASNLYP